MEPKDEIKQKIDVTELIGEYLELKRSGSGMMALCPFHSEKTPSFHVSSEKQIWHCFGCQEGGDIFSFVMKMEGIDFPEALRLLAKRAGVEIPRFSSAKSNERQRLTEINELAAKFFNKVLLESPKAAAARKYVESRGIDKELVEKFRLGFATDTWDSLTNFLSKRSFSLKECEMAGLVQRKKSGSGCIDRFRNRVMIPLCDPHGNVVGFTGRVLDPEAMPKYMNSPETPVYKKGEILYGLHLAKRAIKDEQSVIIVEGNLDIIASHKAGVENVVASSGTALTERQLSLLKRFTDRIIFCFDQDAAGFKAARRGIKIASQMGLRLDVILIPEEAGKDPDDVVQKNPELWRTAVKNTVPIMKYFIDQSLSGRNLNDVNDKKEFWSFLSKEIAGIPEVVEREHWLQVVADLLRTDINELRKDVSQAAKQQPIRPEAAKASPKLPKPEKKTRADHAAEAVLALFLQLPEERERIISSVQADLLPAGELRELYTFLILSYNNAKPNPYALKSFFGWLCDQLQNDPANEQNLSLIYALGVKGESMVADLPPNQVQGQLEEYIHVLKTAVLKKDRKELEAQIRRAEAQGDHELVKKLVGQYNKLR